MTRTSWVQASVKVITFHSLDEGKVVGLLSFIATIIVHVQPLLPFDPINSDSVSCSTGALTFNNSELQFQWTVGLRDTLVLHVS